MQNDDLGSLDREQYECALSVFARVFPELVSRYAPGQELEKAATDTAAALVAGLTRLRAATGNTP